MDASVVDEFDPDQDRPGARPLQSRQRAALFGRVHRPLPRRPARPQPADHRLGQGRAGAAERRRRSRHPLPALPHLGRPALHGPGDRPVRAALPRLLPRRSGPTPTSSPASAGPTRCGPGSRCGAWRPRSARAARSWPRSTLPALVVQSTGDMGVFPSDARASSRALASADKTLETGPRRALLRGRARLSR